MKAGNQSIPLLILFAWASPVLAADNTHLAPSASKLPQAKAKVVEEAEDDSEEEESDADASNRGSSLSLGSSLAQGYGSGSLDATFGLGKVWAIKAGVSQDFSDGEFSSREARLGVDADTSESFSWALMATGRQESNDILAAGIEPGFDWTISSLWKGAQSTVFSASVEETLYFSTAAKGKSWSNSIGESVLNFGLSQGVMDRLTLSLDARLYVQSVSATSLVDAIGKKKRRFGGSTGLIDGIPIRTFSVSTDYQVTDSLGLGVSFSQSRVASTYDMSRAIGATFDYSINETWSIDGGVEGSRNYDSATGIFENQGAVASIGLSYGW